jgi:hypothetical protein
MSNIGNIDQLKTNGGRGPQLRSIPFTKNVKNESTTSGNITKAFTGGNLSEEGEISDKNVSTTGMQKLTEDQKIGKKKPELLKSPFANLESKSKHNENIKKNEKDEDWVIDKGNVSTNTNAVQSPKAPPTKYTHVHDKVNKDSPFYGVECVVGEELYKGKTTVERFKETLEETLKKRAKGKNEDPDPDFDKISSEDFEEAREKAKN